VREEYCWLVCSEIKILLADKPSEQDVDRQRYSVTPENEGARA
jgi:hypothetical protein